jgi:uncharacterized protein YukE
MSGYHFLAPAGARESGAAWRAGSTPRWLLAAALAVTACASSPAPGVTTLASAWPTATPDSYDDVYQRWTRRGEDFNELVQTVSLSATLHTAEFRAAYLHERARRLLMTSDEEAALAEAEKRALNESWEVELLVATAKPDWNDLHKAARPATGQPDRAGTPGSMWRLALVGDDEREVTPISVLEDRRHREDVQAYFPDMKPFYHAYVVRFPRATADGRQLVGERGKLALKVGSPVGRVKLEWSPR